MLFDIVIPLGPNERSKIHQQVEYTKKNVIGYRNIYIVTNNYDNLQVENCKIIDETLFPFKMSDIAHYFAQYNGKKNKNGWYFQQLLKLYSSFVIDDLLDNYLVIDADVFFLKPIHFSEENKYVFTISREDHEPYFKHLKRLHPSLDRQINVSGVSHHMFFNKQLLQELFNLVEKYHGNGKKFWNIFIECVDEHRNHDVNYLESGASEYELYFNYMLLNHQDKIIVRELNWRNTNNSYNIEENINGYDYISICWYL
jgi:hypothetical protein